MSPSQALVSVITPLYNYEQYIAEAIESVLSQSYSQIEMIIVDDGSSDRGTAVVERYVSDRVKLFRQPRHGCGVARALNLALSQAQGEFISWLSADDYYLPHKIERQLEVFQSTQEQRPKLGILHSQPGVESADPDYLHKYCPLPEAEQTQQLIARGSVYWPFAAVPADDQEILLSSLMWNQINGCATLIPKAVFDQVGGFNNSWSVCQDYDMWLRIMLAGYEVCYLPEVLSVSRFHPINTSQYNQIIPAESQLVLRSNKERIQLAQIQPALAQMNIAPEQFPIWYARLMSQQGIADEALWTLEQLPLQQKQDPQITDHCQQLRTQIQPFNLSPMQSSPSLSWLITLTPGAFKIQRLLAALTGFCEAFNAEDTVQMLIWHPPAMQNEVQAELSKWQAQIAHFLNREPDSLPQILTSQLELEKGLSDIQAYLPIGNPDPLEARCLYSLRTQNYLIQWSAESADFIRARAYLSGAFHWSLPRPRPLSQILWPEAVHGPIGHGGQAPVFSRNSWLQLSYPQLSEPAHPELYRWGLHNQNLELVDSHRFCLLPLPETAYYPDWAPRSKQPFAIEGLSGDSILILYEAHNASCWKESLSAFIATGLNQEGLSLLVLATVSPDQEEAVFNELLTQLEADGVDPEQVENIVITCLESPDWSALFQSVQFWIHPVSGTTEPLQWLKYWPYLAHSSLTLITTAWLHPDLSAAVLTSPLEQLSKTVQWALEDRTMSAAYARALRTHFPAQAPDHAHWVQALSSHIFGDSL